MLSSPKIRQSNPTWSKKTCGSYPIQFNSKKATKNRKCRGFFPRLCCFPGDAPKLPTFPYDAHLAPARCQRCQSPRCGSATFTVLVAGFKAKIGRWDPFWQAKIIPFQWVFVQFHHGYFVKSKKPKKIHQEKLASWKRTLPQVSGWYNSTFVEITFLTTITLSPSQS